MQRTKPPFRADEVGSLLRPQRVKEARAQLEKGEISADYSDEELEILAWALMGANVFLGLRFSVWASTDPALVADTTAKLLRSGLAK